LFEPIKSKPDALETTLTSKLAAVYGVAPRDKHAVFKVSCDTESCNAPVVPPKLSGAEKSPHSTSISNV
jgi:hypothetical protein